MINYECASCKHAKILQQQGNITIQEMNRKLNWCRTKTCPNYNTKGR